MLCPVPGCGGQMLRGAIVCGIEQESSRVCSKCGWDPVTQEDLNGKRFTLPLEQRVRIHRTELPCI
jgi:hypothetical protein